MYDGIFESDINFKIFIYLKVLSNKLLIFTNNVYYRYINSPKFQIESIKCNFNELDTNNIFKLASYTSN